MSLVPRCRRSDDDVAQPGITPDQARLRVDVHRVVVPILNADDGDGRTVADVDLDVGSMVRAADMVEHDSGRRVRRHVDNNVAI